MRLRANRTNMWQEKFVEKEVTSLKVLVEYTEENVVHLRTATKGQALCFVGPCETCTLPGARLVFFAVELVNASLGWTIKMLPASRVVALQDQNQMDLFIEPCCGLGAMSLGLGECGFRPIAAMDVSQLAVDVYSENHQIHALLGSIMDQTEMARLLIAAGGLRCGLVVGFPCPPFSTRGDQQGFGDSRSEVFIQVLNMAYLFDSKYVILECTSQTGRWPEVQDYLRSLAHALGFGIAQNVLHLHRAWPCYRTRWWAVLAPLEVMKHFKALKDLPLAVPAPQVEDIIPLWPRWELEEEKALAWSSFEMAGYLKHSSEEQMLLSMKGVAPTVLHSCGHHFYPCPCGCRATGLSEARLQRDGISVIAIRSEHEEVGLRHLHPEEAGFLCTIFPGFKYPKGDLRLGLPLVGQLAAPLQTHWVGCQLKDALITAGVCQTSMDFDGEALHLAFLHKLKKLQVHNWPAPWTYEQCALSLRFPDGNQLEIKFSAGQRVKHLLKAQAAIEGWGARLTLWHDGLRLDDHCYLKSLSYDLVVNTPRSLSMIPSGLIQVKIRTDDGARTGTFSAGVRMWQVLEHLGLQVESNNPFISDLTLADQIWFTCEQEFRGGGRGEGILDVDLENEAKQLLECLDGNLRVHLIPVRWLSQTLTKPSIVANYLIKKHLHGILEDGCPDRIVALCCIDQHWLLYVYVVAEQQVYFYDSLIGHDPRQINTLHLAVAEFFDVKLPVPPALTLLVQQQDDFCGSLCLVNLGWNLGLWTSFAYSQVGQWHRALKDQECLRGGGATDWATAHAWLVDFMPSRGVPTEKAAERASQALKKLSLNAVLKAIQDPNPWKQLKMIGSNASKPFLWVTAEELKIHIAARATQKFNLEEPKKNRKKEVKPSAIVGLVPDRIVLPKAVFLDEDGSILQQISSEAVKADARGVAVVGLDFAQRFLIDPKVISHDHLALLTPVVVPTPLSSSLVVESLTWPAIYDSEPLLIRGSIIQLGDHHVALRTGPKPKVAAIHTALMRIQMYKDQTPLQWDEFLKGPLKQIVTNFAAFQLCHSDGCGTQCPKFHAALDESCDMVLLDCFAWRWYNSEGTIVSAAKAVSFSVMIRTPAPAVEGILALSGRDGLYTELREDTSGEIKYAVIWLKTGYDDSFHTLRTQPLGLHLARLHQRYGIRCYKKNEAAIRSLLFPDQPFVECDIKLVYQVGPWPYGTSKKAVQDAITAIPWIAKVVRPCKSGQDGRFWVVGAAKAPTEPIFAFGEHHITISHLKDMQHMKQEHNVVATLQTMQRLQTQHPSKSTPDPLLAADPWAEYRAKMAGASSSSDAPAKRIETIQKELTNSVQEQIRAQFEAMHDSPMEDDQKQRLDNMESSINELRLQSQTYQGWFNESATRMNDMQYTIQEQGQALETIRTDLQQQTQTTAGLQQQIGALDHNMMNRLQSAHEALAERLENMFAKRIRVSDHE